MAVYPDKSRVVPDGAYTASTVSALQDVTEDSIRQQLKLKNLSPWESFRQRSRETINDIFKSIANAFAGILDDDGNEWLTMIRDKQLQYNDRVDLLNPLLDYCSAYAAFTDNDHARFGPGLMKFSEQIGPARNVEITPEGRFKLLDKGLWDIRATVLPSWTGFLRKGDIYISMNVRDPQGGLYSEQTLIEDTTNYTSFSIVSSVVVPEAGYTVEVNIDQLDSQRGILGGPKWSRLTVQHLSRTVTGRTGGEPSTVATEAPDESEAGA